MTPTLPNFYSEDEVCALLRLKKATLRARIACGTEHPPVTKARNGVYYCNKKLFEDWLSTRPTLREVRRVSEV